MKIQSGAYVKFRGKQNQESTFVVLYIRGKEAYLKNCWGGKFWHAIAGLKMA